MQTRAWAHRTLGGGSQPSRDPAGAPHPLSQEGMWAGRVSVGWAVPRPGGQSQVRWADPALRPTSADTPCLLSAARPRGLLHAFRTGRPPLGVGGPGLLLVGSPSCRGTAGKEPTPPSVGTARNYPYPRALSSWLVCGNAQRQGVSVPDLQLSFPGGDPPPKKSGLTWRERGHPVALPTPSLLLQPRPRPLRSCRAPSAGWPSHPPAPRDSSLSGRN